MCLLKKINHFLLNDVKYTQDQILIPSYICTTTDFLSTLNAAKTTQNSLTDKAKEITDEDANTIQTLLTNAQNNLKSAEKNYTQAKQAVEDKKNIDNKEFLKNQAQQKQETGDLLTESKRMLDEVKKIEKMPNGSEQLKRKLAEWDANNNGILNNFLSRLNAAKDTQKNLTNHTIQGYLDQAEKNYKEAKALIDNKRAASPGKKKNRTQ